MSWAPQAEERRFACDGQRDNVRQTEDFRRNRVARPRSGVRQSSGGFEVEVLRQNGPGESGRVRPSLNEQRRRRARFQFGHEGERKLICIDERRAVQG